MDNQKIWDEYNSFGIPEHLIPKYTNANEFAKNFEKCSILEDSNNVSYSNSTVFQFNDTQRK